MHTRKIFLVVSITFIVLSFGWASVYAQENSPEVTAASLGTGFTYQGFLKNNSGNPITALCSFRFNLWDSLSAGTQLGTYSLSGWVNVTQGIFTAQVNTAGEFGTSAFTGQARWLEVGVKCGSEADYTVLSPRQALTAAPYALGLMPGANVVGNLTGGSVFRAENTASSAWSNGLSGKSNSPGGMGVYGYASASSGSTYGIYGRADSPGGVGVYGENTANSGGTAGVEGISHATDGGVGVYGIGVGSTGAIYGVYGWSQSSGGSGVLGYATSTIGSSIGVEGRSDSTSGYGLHGLTSAATGTTYGVYGESSSTAGYGLYGIASAATGTNYGVYGQSNSPSGYGVYAQSSGTAIYAKGSYRAVHAWASATSGSAYGVYARFDSTNGAAVSAWAMASTGNTYGVYGYAVSTSGTGVLGIAGTPSGTNYGVYGQSSSTDGSGVVASNLSETGAALTIDQGSFRVAGAGEGTDTTVFVHVAHTGASGNMCDVTCGLDPDPHATVIDNSLVNGDPNAILFVTYSGNGDVENPAISVYYDSNNDCGYGQRWVINNSCNTSAGAQPKAIEEGARFNVWVVKP